MSRKEVLRKYNASEKGKLCRKKFEQSERGKLVRAEINRRHREKHKDYYKSYNVKYKMNNRALFNNYQSLRRSYTDIKTLTDEEREHVLRFYECAKLLSEVTGEEYHIDHIIPLSKGGKHHPSNLQILTAEENLKKGSKYIGEIRYESMA